ncbi:MAG: hypothetical protein HYV63_06575 [Candidatus Schekmanbacteria bacterium]|nr:hypothetical protein [Candidatus Schekmanbacteria bacterium]
MSESGELELQPSLLVTALEAAVKLRRDWLQRDRGPFRVPAVSEWSEQKQGLDHAIATQADRLLKGRLTPSVLRLLNEAIEVLNEAAGTTAYRLWGEHLQRWDDTSGAWTEIGPVGSDSPSGRVDDRS